MEPQTQETEDPTRVCEIEERAGGSLSSRFGNFRATSGASGHGADGVGGEEGTRLVIPTAGLWARQSPGVATLGSREAGESESGLRKSRPWVVTGRALREAHFRI